MLEPTAIAVYLTLQLFICIVIPSLLAFCNPGTNVSVHVAACAGFASRAMMQNREAENYNKLDESNRRFGGNYKTECERPFNSDIHREGDGRRPRKKEAKIPADK